MKKRNYAFNLMLIILAVAVCVSLSSCGGPKIVGVKTLAAANIAAQSQVENYHVDGTVKMNITMDEAYLPDFLKSTDVKLPVTITMDANAGKQTAHVNTKTNAKILKQSIDVQTMEMYTDLENKATYARYGDSSEWEKKDYQSYDMDFTELVGGIAVVGKTVLKNATYSESDEYYTLSMPAKEAGNLIEDLHLLDSVDVGIADVRDIKVEGGQIIYNVNKETYLVDSVELKDIDLRGKGTYESVSVDLLFPTNGIFNLSNYDEVDSSEYTIPQEVIDSAK